MSTSDAAELELRVGGGGESPTPQRRTARLTRTITPREQQNGTFDTELKQEDHLSDGTQTEQESERPACRQEGTHKVIFRVNQERKEEDTSYCYDPKIQTQRPDRHRFTSSVSFRLSIQTDLREEPDPSTYSLTEPQGAEESERRRSQVNGGTSPAGTSIETACDVPLSVKIPVPDEKEDKLVTVSCNTLEATSDQFGPHVNAHIRAFLNGPRPGRTFFEAVALERDLKDYTSLRDRAQPAALYDSTATMLSPTIVSALTPPWGGRLGWSKRGEARGNEPVSAYSRHSVEKGLRDGSQEQLRTQFMESRRNTVGWSHNTGLDFKQQRNVLHSVSMEVNSGRLDNRNIDAGTFSSGTTPSSPLSPLGSKPTTSSILLSSRRLNTNSNISPTPSKINPLSLTSPTSDQGGKLLMSQFSQSCFNNNGQEKPLLSPSSLSYRTRETTAILFPPSSSQREGGLPKTPASLLNKERADTLFSQQPHTVIRAQTCLSHPRLTSLPKELSEGGETRRGADKMEKQLSESSMLSPTQPSYDLSASLKKQSLPRRTTLLSSSSWKQVSQELSSPHALDDITNNKYTTNTHSAMNVVWTSQEGAHTHWRHNADDSLGQESSHFLKRQSYSNPHDKEPQHLQSLPGVLSIPKFSAAKPQTKLTSTPGNPISPNTLNNNYHIPRTSTSPTSPHNNRDSPNFHQTFSTDVANTLNSQAFNSHPVSSQTSAPASFLSGCPSDTLAHKYTNRVATAPLGFERSYASMSKSSHQKAMSSLISTHAAFSPATTLTTSPTSGVHAGVITPSRPSLVTPPLTPVSAFSSTALPPSCLLTPPATPVILPPTQTAVWRESPKQGKRERRVTWKDSTDHQQSETTTVEKALPSQVPANPSSSKPTKNATSIFSFLRSGSPTADTPSTPKTSNIQVWRGEKPQSLSSDFTDQVSREGRRVQRLSDSSLQTIFDQRGRDSTPIRQEQTLSVDQTDYCRTCAPQSLPPDFSTGYKLRYSSPPYSTLMSTRLTQGENKNAPPRAALFQETSSPSQSKFTSHLSMQTDPVGGLTSPNAKLPHSPVGSLQPLAQHFQNKAGLPESSKCGASETDRANNNHCSGQDKQMILIDNRVHVSSEPLPAQGNKVANSLSTCVTQTLVYRISKAGSTAAQNNTTPKPLSQHTTKKQVPVESHTSQTTEDVDNARNPPNQNPGGSGATEGQTADDQCTTKRMKDIKSPKKSRFALKRSGSATNSSSSANKEISLDKAKAETERLVKSSKKMDLVLNKIRQTFSSKRSDDDPSYPWKSKRAPQTPSVSGSSDISDASDVTVESNRTLQEEETGMLRHQYQREAESTDRWEQNRYTLVPPPAVGIRTGRQRSSSWLDESTNESKQDKAPVFDVLQGQEQMHQSKNQAMCQSQNPAAQQLDFNKENRPNKQFLSCRESSPCTSPNNAATFPTQLKKPTSSPRSPFSPFSTLSPVTSAPPADVSDDSVFYSPKLQRRRESSSSCEPRDRISLVDQRRSRTSTGPPGGGPGQDKEQLDSLSSYADLKYGIEPGRSVSVSSVLSSRPSGPGRISTGTRFMSVGDLSKSGLSCGSYDRDLDQWSITNDWTTKCNYQPTNDHRMSTVHSKARSRSLPRSLTKCFSNWSADVDAPPPDTVTDGGRGSDMDISHFVWDIKAPPTPPPTPPLSPVSRRMSRPPSLSSPTSPSPSGSPQDTQSARGILPSRGYVASLSTFQEFSDSGSDSTTDDEYYLELDEGEGKETEL
ncbi:uncharacterized protein LOC143009076 isoform X2 [Genypterus blacodes]|uniref:uncharacterized protein LOC143009076 isoform X2 n=1 Tax=Genypterus blacodes TaxID=154954 RepID=UPI003F759E9E